MSNTIQPLMNGTKAPAKKGETAKGNSNFEKLLTMLADGKTLEKKSVNLPAEAEPAEAVPEEPSLDSGETKPSNSHAQAIQLAEKLAEKLADDPKLKQLLLGSSKENGSSEAGVHGFTKEELFKFESAQQKSLKTVSTSNISEESEANVKVMKLAETEPVLLKQSQSELHLFLKRNGIDLSSLTGKALNQEQAAPIETATVRIPEENEQVQVKPNETLTQTTVKEETPVIKARQFTSEFSQLLERMQVMKNGKESQLRIKLSPENLGQLDIRLSTVDGKVTAQIATSTAAAKEMIEGQLHQLRQTFVQQGIQLDKVEVVQQSTQSLLQDQQSQQQGQRQFGQGNRREKQSGQYEVEENPVVTHEHEQEETIGINYSV
ncbi:flagellar hook-length control protein FliK [Alkalihalobacillus sp. CinArs1]|uniref:flagellar hook-length control protein FliK n=1 Tax=Alkalihalobacillus sp. CinArs1 TaxID=2995314 RepID=UPI0022DDA799|nr:flagellar hook-length control protein FliK [Alkalihalobacillus sp. CinArs1]